MRSLSICTSIQVRLATDQAASLSLRAHSLQYTPLSLERSPRSYITDFTDIDAASSEPEPNLPAQLGRVRPRCVKCMICPPVRYALCGHSTVLPVHTIIGIAHGLCLAVLLIFSQTRHPTGSPGAWDGVPVSHLRSWDSLSRNRIPSMSEAWPTRADSLLSG